MSRVWHALVTPLFIVSSLSAQNVVVDWVAKSLVSSPSKINKKTTIEIEVQNVNDVLYTYSIQISGTPRADNDFAAIASAFGAQKGATEGADPCPPLATTVQSSSANLGSAVTAFYKLPETQSKTCSQKAPCSINLKDTRSAWTAGVEPKVTAATTALTALQQLPICQKTYVSPITDLQSALSKVNDTQAYLFSDNHSISTETTLEPDIDYAVAVKELYISSGSSVGTQTNASTLSVTFSPATDRLTLSAGALFSEIQNRAYTSQAAPNLTGTGTQNVLAVSGISTFSPLALALLNYELPSFGKVSFGNDDIGLAVSTGPALRLGSKSNTSSFGYFMGLGVHLYHRFYISPGVNIGEFADYPPGFTAPNQPVPSGLGTLTPTNRYTARFSFGITYKTKDFSSLGLTTGTQTSPSPTASKTAPSVKAGTNTSTSGAAPSTP